MRTLIACRSHSANSEIVRVLDAYSWLPGRPEGDQVDFDRMLARRNAEILETIPENKREAARGTLVCSIYAADLDTWGIVTKEQSHTFYFRLVNHNARRLRVLSERLVQNLRDEAPKQIPGGADFVFTGYVSILEQGSDRETQRGTFLSRGLGGLIRERRWEVILTGCVFMVAVLAFILSFPKTVIDLSTIQGVHARWWLDFWGRLSTALLVPAFTAGLTGIFLLFDRARHPVIVWRHK